MGVLWGFCGGLVRYPCLACCMTFSFFFDCIASLFDDDEEEQKSKKEREKARAGYWAPHHPPNQILLKSF